MSVTVRALWYVETHLDEDLSLDAVAAAVGVSRYHLTRAFGATLGVPLATYTRGRRLSRAAHRLAAGVPDILGLALDTGYGSHEAFTRAFVQQFGITPEQVRQLGHTDALALVPPVRMDEPATQPFEPPRIESGRTLRLAGISERHGGTITALPTQWSRFIPLVGHVPGQMGRVVYGVTYNVDETTAFDYMCGVEVDAFLAEDPPFSRLTIPAQTYAVFTHREHITSLAAMIGAVLDRALGAAGYALMDGPFFERYDERFDPRTGHGDVEVWFPVAGGS